MNNRLEETKEKLIKKINERENDKILEKNNADIIRKLIKNADNTQEAYAIYQMGNNTKTTGLHFDSRYEVIKGDSIFYFKKNDKYSFDQGGIKHQLILGDNFNALQNLLVNYKESVDVIYIDPPYAKDFMGNYAEMNYNNELTRDNLLSSLEPRLELSYDLLNDDGIIFISIDDRNEAYIKCLMDEIFGEENFVASCPRKTVSSKTTKSNHELQKLYDYVLIYTKSSSASFTKEIVGEKKYPYHDDRGDYYLVPLQDNGPHGTRTARPNLYYPIYKTTDGRLTYNRETDADEEFLPKKHKGDDGRWMWSKKKFDTDNKDLTISEKGIVSIKHYYHEGEDTNKYQAWKDWLDQFTNAKGTSLLGEVIGKNKFSNPKPIELLKWCTCIHPNKDAIVLDFYAGSGSTGHAILDINKEDGGKRKFILCTLDVDEGQNIGFDITAERLKRIMTGSGYKGETDFEWIKKNEPYGDSLEVIDIKDVANSQCEEGKSPFDVIDETLYGVEKFDNLQDKIRWVCENFDNTQYYLKNKKKED